MGRRFIQWNIIAVFSMQMSPGKAHLIECCKRVHLILSQRSSVWYRPTATSCMQRYEVTNNMKIADIRTETA